MSAIRGETEDGGGDSLRFGKGGGTLQESRNYCIRQRVGSSDPRDSNEWN